MTENNNKQTNKQTKNTAKLNLLTREWIHLNQNKNVA